MVVVLWQHLLCSCIYQGSSNSYVAVLPYCVYSVQELQGSSVLVKRISVAVRSLLTTTRRPPRSRRSISARVASAGCAATSARSTRSSSRRGLRLPRRRRHQSNEAKAWPARCPGGCGRRGVRVWSLWSAVLSHRTSNSAGWARSPIAPNYCLSYLLNALASPRGCTVCNSM